MDVITINKQTNPDLNIRKLIKKEGAHLLTKGLLARIYYNSMQSLVFFNLVMYIGKIYNVEYLTTEEKLVKFLRIKIDFEF